MARIPPGNGLPVTFRDFNYGDMVRREWGADWNIPDYVYEMTNGRKFDSTDMQKSGVYGVQVYQELLLDPLNNYPDMDGQLILLQENGQPLLLG